jgi:hypothetical protein
MLDKKEPVDDYINMGVRMQLLLPVIIWKNCTGFHPVDKCYLTSLSNFLFLENIKKYEKHVEKGEFSPIER